MTKPTRTDCRRSDAIFFGQADRRRACGPQLVPTFICRREPQNTSGSAYAPPPRIPRPVSKPPAPRRTGVAEGRIVRDASGSVHHLSAGRVDLISQRRGRQQALLRSTGTVVNISSVGGKVAMSTYGAYAGSKFALEAVSDSLRREVTALGVKVVVIEPGAVKTEMAERAVAAADRLNANMTTAQLQRYGDLTEAISAQARSFTKIGVPAEHAAKVIATAATASRPRTRYTIGRDAAILVRLARVVSDRFLDRILRLGLRPHYVKNSQPSVRRSDPSISIGAGSRDQS
jgi:NAD(P)-dependent dehydrogenase (short-subunit alcohol dehydrogenase family)